MIIRGFLLLILLTMAVVMVAESDQHAADQYLPRYELEPRP